MIFLELHFAYPGDDRHDTDKAALEAASDRDFEARTIGVSAAAAAAIATEIAVRVEEQHLEASAALRGASR